MDTEAEEMAKHQELMREKALLVTHILSKLTIDLLLSNIPWNSQPYHTSALSGEAWLIKLILGHPDCIRCELGMHQEKNTWQYSTI